MSGALCPAQVTARSNGDLCTVGAIVANVNLTPAERMFLILVTAECWDAATQGSTERQRAARADMAKHYRTLGVES